MRVEYLKPQEQFRVILPVSLSLSLLIIIFFFSVDLNDEKSDAFKTLRMIPPLSFLP